MANGNRLFCGDNLAVMREHIADATVDLCYIDPPFHSLRNYRGKHEDAAFSDLWNWDAAAESGLRELQSSSRGQLLSGIEPVVGRGTLLAYLVSVAQRLGEIDRVLRPTGSLFLHCDPTASHYLKLLLDATFREPG